MTPASSPEQEYFRRIEDTFIRLRGAPFLLSPSDWRLAQSWFDEAIPVELVCRALETLFERRAERAAQGKVQSLRYCAAAVESAWAERRELGALQQPGEAPAMDVAARLESLARALPASLADAAQWAARVRSLTGAAKVVEESLADLDSQLVDACIDGLESGERARLEEAVTGSLASLRDRLTPEVLAADQRRLVRERARRQAGLPLLSLFSPDAVET